MKRLIGLILLALIGFYVFWPGLSATRIYQALEAQDPDRLNAKVDFDSVRESLRPAVEMAVAKAAGGAGVDPALLVVLSKDVLPKLVDPVLKAVVSPTRIVRIYADHKAGITVEDSVRQIVKEQMGGLKLGGLNLGAVAGLVKGAAGGGKASGAGDGGNGGLDLGGIGQALGVDPAGIADELAKDPEAGPPSAAVQAEPGAQPAAAAKAKSVGLANLKSVAFAGPLSFALGLVRDAKSAEADATVTMSFQGGDWKLTAIRPKL